MNPTVISAPKVVKRDNPRFTGKPSLELKLANLNLKSK